MSSCFHTKIVGMNSIVSECQFHIEIKAQNFAEEERNGDARVSLLLLLSSSMGFAGDYLAFAGVGCSLVRAANAAVCCCRPHWSGGEERKRIAGRSWSSHCFWTARPSLAGEKNGSEAAPGCRRDGGGGDERKMKKEGWLRVLVLLV
ncbi:hypothetical protein KY289_001772 [Solanum tuberosum]|nr:hypothetical protein KY289_001772 [Solanum tuberosum]